MTITQLSVFVENSPGALARVTGILAKNNIDIRAMSLAETQNFGVLRLIVDDYRKAGEVLEKNNFVFHFTNVVAAAIPDEPGGLAQVLSLLADASVNITYMYAFIAVSGHCATVVLRISSAQRQRAIDALTAGGVRIFDEKDISSL